MTKRLTKRAKPIRSRGPHNWRIKALFLIFLILAVALVWRLYTIQIVNGDYYAALALGQHSNLDEIVPPRGEVYVRDNAGKGIYLVATNKEVPMVYGVPSEIDDPQGVLMKIAKIININEAQYEKILTRLHNQESSYALIARQLSADEAASLKALDIEGVYLRNELTRFYPAGDTTSHILGFVGFRGDERVGQYGVEGFYDDILAGLGLRLNAGDVFGLANIFPQKKILAPPAIVGLTLDYGVQFIVKQKLQEALERFDAESASAIFMDPTTGEIIAFVNLPAYDPNYYNEVEDIGLFLNPGAQSLFEPGSVFKPLTMAAAIDGGAVTPNTLYNDKGVLHIDGYSIYNSDNEAHGTQTMTEVLEKSLNTGAIFAQQELGKKKFRDYLEAFQLDKRTGIDLPGEIVGDIKNIQNTNRDINFATASFGQGIAMTPLRLLSSLSALANGGIIMKPYVVDHITRGDEESKVSPQVVTQAISPTTAARVTAMMVSAVENGFGEKASVPGYSVAGKTGTAQVPNENAPGYSDNTIHSFVGFVPAYNPRFIGIIKLDNPKNIRFAADSVAPIFGELAAFLLQYYKIPPQ